MEFADGKLILCGHFNVPLDPTVDTSSGTSSVPLGPRKMFCRRYDLQLVDAWSILRVGERDYTFLTIPHQLYSRIDLFLVSHQLLSSVLDVSIGHITWSDHAPVMLRLSLSMSDLPPGLALALE